MRFCNGFNSANMPAFRLPVGPKLYGNCISAELITPTWLLLLRATYMFVVLLSMSQKAFLRFVIITLNFWHMNWTSKGGQTRRRFRTSTSPPLTVSIMNRSFGSGGEAWLDGMAERANLVYCCLLSMNVNLIAICRLYKLERLQRRIIFS